MSLMRCHDCDRNIDIDYEEMFNESKCMKCFLRDNPEEKHCSNMVKDNQGRDCLPCGDVVGEMGDYVKAICKECIEKEKSNLDRAKELRDKMDKRKDQMKMMTNILYEKSYEFSKYNKLITQIKQLKEKINKHCEYCMIIIKRFESEPQLKYCKDCEETLKILEEILE